jgi:hypothetical protein
MRLAAGAATASVAYQAGQRRGQAGVDDRTSVGVPQRPAAPAPDDTPAQLAQLAQLHTSGALSDAEFASAKSKLLGS